MTRFEGIQLMYATDTLNMGGSFTDMGVGEFCGDYVAQWNGRSWDSNDWTAVGGALYGYPIVGIDADYPIACRFCGGLWAKDDACTQCSAPTDRWWARLDEMIAAWKRGSYA